MSSRVILTLSYLKPTPLALSSFSSPVLLLSFFTLERLASLQRRSRYYSHSFVHRIKSVQISTGVLSLVLKGREEAAWNRFTRLILSCLLVRVCTRSSYQIKAPVCASSYIGKHPFLYGFWHNSKPYCPLYFWDSILVLSFVPQPPFKRLRDLISPILRMKGYFNTLKEKGSL